MEDSVKILILEDLSTDVELILDRIQDTKLKFSHLWVESEEEFRKGILEFTPDIIISDYMLPNYTGLEALHLASNLCPSTPFIIVTGEANEDVAIECRKFGAIEYVMKEHLKSIGPAIKQSLEKKHLKVNKEKAEKSLKENEEKFRSIFETANDAILIADDDGNITSFNDSFLYLFGYETEEIQGQPFANLIRQKPGEETSFDIRRIPINKEQQFENKQIRELEGQRKDGSIFPLELSLSDWNANGNHFFTVIIRDITARKQVELALIREKEKSDEINRLKSCFLANISHEIRSPLVGILGFAHILLEELSDSKHLEMAQNILMGGKKLKYILTQILDYTSIEDNKCEVLLKPSNLFELVNDVVKSFSKEIELKNIYIKIKCQDDNVIANVDEKLLRIVLNNLISNSITFTEKGGITLNVYKSRVIGKFLANVSIKDTGVGIPLKNQVNIFRPYQPGRKILKKNNEGLGLGLAIARRMVRLMHGEIELESELNEGSIFTIHLPLCIEDRNSEMYAVVNNYLVESNKFQTLN